MPRPARIILRARLAPLLVGLLVLGLGTLRLPSEELAETAIAGPELQLGRLGTAVEARHRCNRHGTHSFPRNWGLSNCTIDCFLHQVDGPVYAPLCTQPTIDGFHLIR